MIKLDSDLLFRETGSFYNKCLSNNNTSQVSTCHTNTNTAFKPIQDSHSRGQ